MSSSVVSTQKVGDGVVQITMEDREHKNTFSDELILGLIEAFRVIQGDPQYRAVVLTGYDSYFCSGGTQESLRTLQAGRGRFTDTNVYSLPLECEIPVIAAMQGHGIGGGLALGLFADCIVLSRESVYTANFMKYGFTPGMGATLILPRKLGASLAEEMLLSARNYRGAELGQRGVPFPVVPRNEVVERAAKLAREIAVKPRMSLVTLKTHLVSGIRRELAETVAQELAMHERTFHQPEVLEKINSAFGV